MHTRDQRSTLLSSLCLISFSYYSCLLGDCVGMKGPGGMPVGQMIVWLGAWPAAAFNSNFKGSPWKSFSPLAVLPLATFGEPRAAWDQVGET